MAHDVEGEGPYPALAAAFDAIEFPGLALIYDPGGLYICEDISEDPQVLWGATCLLVQWAVDQMAEQFGKAEEAKLLASLERWVRLRQEWLRAEPTGKPE